MRAVHPDGFTLVEILVSVAVLSILIVLVGEIFSAATQSVGAGTQHLDVDSESRLVFDRMADDFDNMLKGSDVDYIFSKQDSNQNDKMFFFSHAPGFSDVATDTQCSLTSLIGYRVNATTLQLERLGKGLDWTGTQSGGNPGSVPLLTYPVDSSGKLSTSPDPASTIEGNWPKTVGAAPEYEGTDDDYHLLGEGVFRLEFCFLETINAGGTITDKYVSPPSPTPGNDPLQFSTTDASGNVTTTTVKGIVVTIAILDQESRKILADTSHLASSLPDVEGAPPLTTWTTTIQTQGYAQAAGIPAADAAHVRLYQRTFYLNLPPAQPTP